MSEIYRSTRVTRELPGMLEFLELWASNTTKLWAVHILLGVVATFFSLLAAALMGDPYIGWARAFAFIAALSISMMTAFNLGAKSNNTRNAWRKLNAAMLKFNQEIVSKEYVIRAYEEGESLIGGVTFSQAGIQYEPTTSEHDENGPPKPHTTVDKDPNQHTTEPGESPTIK